MDFPSAALNPIQQPDLIGSYLRGQIGGYQAQAAPYQLQQAQQEVTKGGLTIDQLRMALQTQQAFRNAAQSFAGSFGGGSAGGEPAAAAGTAQAGAQSGASSAGGVQTGPQGGVSSQPSRYQFGDDPLAPLLDLNRIAQGAQLGQLGAVMNGGDPNKPIADALKLENDARAAAIEKGKLAMQTGNQGRDPGPMLKSFAGMSPEQAAASLSAPGNESLLAQYPALAKQYGVTDLFDKRMIPVVAAMEYNRRGAPFGLSVDVPHPLETVNAPFGQQFQKDNFAGGKLTQISGREMPMKVGETYDAGSGQNVAVYKNWVGGGGAPAGNAGNGTISVPTGIKEPSPADRKAAMFASEMRSGLQTLRQYESQGFSLSAPQRTAFINAATSDEPGAIKQLFSQEYLSKMSPDAQTYMAALMPMLQAAGHDQSGARLTTSQVRQNIESLLPPADSIKNPQAMEQINKNRQGFYVGLLGQAGSALQLPQYKDTLGADLKGAQAPAQAPASAIAHLKQHPELASAFKAKYGYLPQPQ